MYWQLLLHSYAKCLMRKILIPRNTISHCYHSLLQRATKFISSLRIAPRLPPASYIPISEYQLMQNRFFSGGVESYLDEGGLNSNVSSYPYFEFNVPRNVTTAVGQTAFLHCRVEQLGDKAVSYCCPLF